MAKMFYTLQEAAAKLGIDEQAVKEMVANDQLQQFRDRDKVMFKVDQVDKLAKGSGSDSSDSSLSGSSIPLVDSGDTDAIDLSSDISSDTSSGQASASGSGLSVFDSEEDEAIDPMAQTQISDTGTSQGSSAGDALSVFEIDEIDDADPMAQTQVSHAQAGEAIEAGLESVGSGSGLLDLTQESDDTSLGAELMDEIYPANAETVAGKEGTSSGSVFEDVNRQTGEHAGSGLTGLDQPAASTSEEQEPGMPASYPSAAVQEPAASGFAVGVLIGATAALVLGIIVTFSGIFGTQDNLTIMMSSSGSNLAVWCIGLLVVSFVFGFVGSLIGRS